MRNLSRATTAAFVLCALLATTATTLAQTGTLENVAVHGKSLENNQLGFSPERTVSVYLPPSYASSPERRYPALYLLHGIGGTNGDWTVAWPSSEPGYATIQDLMDRGVAEGLLDEMIVVAPDARTPFFGCFYTNSSVKGNWADFVANDLVGWVDENYRTIAKPEARGVAGHSMGGHGALKLGMLRPDVFSAVYGMNSALLGWGPDLQAANPGFAGIDTASTLEEAMQGGLYVVGAIGISQAFSPNPDNPPFMVDLHIAKKNGKLADNGPGRDRWQSQMPLYMIEKHADGLRRLQAIRFDTALVDEFVHIPETNKRFSDALTAAGIAHTFEMYNGDHRNRLWGRDGRLFTEVLPYFSELLAAD